MALLIGYITLQADGTDIQAKTCDGRYESDDGQLKCYLEFNNMLSRECRLFELLVSTSKHYSTIA